MLPEDTKERRAAALEHIWQTEVEDYFHTAQPSDKPLPLTPYTDELFKEAAVKWLVGTDQVSDARLITILVWQILNGVAYSSVQTPFLQEYDRSCCLFNSRSQYSRPQADSKGDNFNF